MWKTREIESKIPGATEAWEINRDWLDLRDRFKRRVLNWLSNQTWDDLDDFKAKLVRAAATLNKEYRQYFNDGVPTWANWEIGTLTDDIREKEKFGGRIRAYKGDLVLVQRRDGDSWSVLTQSLDSWGLTPDQVDIIQ